MDNGMPGQHRLSFQRTFLGTPHQKQKADVSSWVHLAYPSAQ